jgi:hypothetical protein
MPMHITRMFTRPMKYYIQCFLGHKQHHSDRVPTEGIHNKQQTILQVSEGGPWSQKLVWVSM